MTRAASGSLLLALLLLPSPAHAITRVIGDADGFGIAPAGLVRPSQAPHDLPADADGDGILEIGEHVPDWDAGGIVSSSGLDVFDTRAPEELDGDDGTEHTDHSLTPTGAPDGLRFTFRFKLPSEAAFDFGVDHQVHLTVGDLDAGATAVRVDGADAAITLTGADGDGAIQGVSVSVPWAALLDGEVIVVLVAPTEDYLAIDSVILTIADLIDTDGDGLPDPIDQCREQPNSDVADADGDGVPDACDSCPADPNALQEDADGDALGDPCDPCPEDDGNDADDDGLCAPQDCDDADPDVFPGAPEGCDDGVDGDCDGAIDALDDDCPEVPAGDDDDDDEPAGCACGSSSSGPAAVALLIGGTGVGLGRRRRG